MNKLKWYQRQIIKEVEVEKRVEVPVVVEKFVMRARVEKPQNSELKHWRGSQCAKFFLQGLRDELEAIKEDIVSGTYTTESIEGTNQLMSKGIGKAEQLQDIIDVIETLGDEEKEE